MITLAAADTLAAGASAATELTSTVFGMELNGTTEVYKVLDQRQLAAAPATIYTAPTSTTAFIKSIVVVNNGTVVRTFSYYRGGTAAENKITPTFSLLPQGVAVYEDGMGWTFYNSAGQLLQGTGSPIMALPMTGITGCMGETMDRVNCPEVNTVSGTTGQVRCQAIWLPAGVTVTNISFHSATTAAGTPTHYVFALYDLARALLATTADQLTAAWAANTIKTLAVTAPYLVPASALYYLMVSVVATTVPTLKGGTAKTGAQLAGQVPILNGLSSTTYATGTAPASLAALTVGTPNIWGCVT